MKTGKLTRAWTLDRAALNVDTRTVRIALSSEFPVVRQDWSGDRWYEILDHSPGACDLTRLRNGQCPLLSNHDSDSQIGILENAGIDLDGVLRADARFSRGEDGEEEWQDVQDGIRTSISVGYWPQEMKLLSDEKGVKTYLVTKWEPCEASLVSIPADPTVGVGRSAENTRHIRIAGGCENPECEDPECEDPICSGLCSAESKCSGCAGTQRNTTPTPPGTLPGTTMEVRMNPETVAAPQAAFPEVRNERIEALQLQALATRAGVGQMASEVLSSDKTLAEARTMILDELARRDSQPMAAAVVDLSKKEAREYSYARAILNSALRQEGSQTTRTFEDEVSETLQASLPSGYKARGGVFVPLQLRAGLDSGTSTAGAELKYTEFGGELIEMLRNYSAVIGKGARVLSGLRSPVSFPKQTGAGTAYWLGENGGADATASALALGTVTLAPKTLQATTSFSRQLLNQSVLGVESLVRNDLAAIHALAIDKAALHGTSANNQPTGIYRTTGVSTKAMGGVPTFGKLQDMITAVATSNALLQSLGWLTTPGMAGVLAQTLRASAAGSDMIWTGNYAAGAINGYAAAATNQVSAVMATLVDTGGAQAGIVFGNWNDLLIGQWGALEILTDPYALKKQGMIEVTSFEMADIQIRHAASFCVSTGATLS